MKGGDPRPSPMSAEDLVEIVDCMGMIAEARVVEWRRSRARSGLFGLDAYGGALVIVRFPDRKLLNLFKRASLVTRGAYSGEWILRSPWTCAGQEAGSEIVMAESVAGSLSDRFAPGLCASVHGYWS